VLRNGEPLEDSQCRHIGAALGEYEGMGEGMSMRDCPRRTLLYQTMHYLPRTLEKGVPMSMGGECEVETGPLLYRSIILPLSRDGERIDHVLGGANGRPVTSEET
jgi:hypothetical protein